MNDYSEMMMQEVFYGQVADAIKASYKTIRNIQVKDIKGFKAAGENLVMMTEHGDVRFEVMTSGMDIFMFYDLLEDITGEEHERTIFINADGYEAAGNHGLTIRNIKNIIKEVSAKADAHEVFSMMLDGFKGKNLVKMADQEQNLKKYVLMALERMCA